MTKCIRFLLFFTFGACLLVLSSCKADNPQSAELVNSEFNHDGGLREYLLYTPENLKENTPLVVVLHGFTSSSEKIMEYTGFNALAKENNFAVVYPQGTKDGQLNSFWNVGYDFHAASTIDDVDFLAQLVSFLQEQYAFSKDNTFATGMSNGGELCYLLACEYPTVFRAVAPVAATMMNNRFAACTPVGAIPVFSIFGTDDTTTKYTGDEQNLDGWGAYKSIPSVIDFWANNIKFSKVEVDTLPDSVEQDSSYVISKRYLGEHPMTELIYYEIIGGGHDWPGAWGNKDINASEEIWEFFSRHLKED